MSHLLTTLADRALGIAPTIEPVRSPMFGREHPGYGEPAEQQTTGFVYGDIVASAQAPQPSTRAPSVESSDTVAREAEHGDTPISPLQPLLSRVLDAPAADDCPPTRIGQQQGQDIMASSTLVDTHSKLTETIAADPESHSTKFSPVTSQTSRTINSHTLADSIRCEKAPEAADARTEPQSAGSLLRPKVVSAPSFPRQPATMDIFPQAWNSSQTLQPTIQVTIGRIEVRAVTTPPPSPAPRERKKPQASLSLDDYLKQRTAGQR